MTSPETSVSEAEVEAGILALAKTHFGERDQINTEAAFATFVAHMRSVFERETRAILTAAAQVRAQAPRSSQYDALLGLLVDVVEPGWPLTSDQAYAMKITAAAAGQIIAALGIRKGE